MVGIKYLCGLQNSSFNVWDSEVKGFTQCFQWLCLTCVSHAVFSIGSAYYLGSSARRHKGRVSKLAFFILILSYFHAISSLTEVILAYTMHIFHPPAYVLSQGLKVSTWTINIILCHNSLRLTRSVRRQNFSTILFFVPVLFSTCINLYSTFEFHKMYAYRGELEFEDYSLFVYCGLNILYWLSVVLLVCQKPKFSSRGRVLPSLVSPNQSRSVYDSDNEEMSSGEGRGLLNTHVKCYDSNSLGSELDKSLLLGRAEEKRSWFSKLLFLWVKPLMVKGYRGHLENADDLFTLPFHLDTLEVTSHVKRFIKHCQILKGKNNATGQSSDDEMLSYSVTKVLHYSFGRYYYSLGVLKFLASSIGFLGPVLLNKLVSFMENNKEPVLHGYYYAIGLFLSTLIGALLDVHYEYQVRKVGMQLRTALITSIYDKTLSVSVATLNKFNSGQIINFMSTDTDRVTNFCNSFHEFWSLPFQIAVTLYLLYLQVQLAFLAGLAFAILLIPINRYLAVKIAKLSKEMMKQKDERVKVMNECLYGIRVIKFYAWETIFSRRIGFLRNLELKSLKERKYLDALCVFFWATTPVIISILTFGTYVIFVDSHLTAAKVFTSIALFNILITPLNAFPWVINGLMEAWVSVKRIQEFLLLDDTDFEGYYRRISSGLNDSTALQMSNGNFSWRRGEDTQEPSYVPLVDVASSGLLKRRTRSRTSARVGIKKSETTEVVPFNLRNINIKAHSGQFIGVIGKVGSGKSSLLAAITGEIDRLDGEIRVPEYFTGFGLVVQEPWIQHMTVRENILFGKPYKHDKYQEVVFGCALEEDLSILPNSDFTEVGEQGVTLSGGQKARIALARAVYQDKDIYLLDDPLAAVDSHVASHLVSHCILELLKGKTRILCTHHAKYLWDADVIIALKDGKVVAMGPPQNILMRDDLLAGVLDDTQAEGNKNTNTEAKEEDNYIDIGLNKNVPLVKDEEKEKGAVSMSVVKAYFFAVGCIVATAVLIFFVLMQISRNLSDWWLAYWISEERDQQPAIVNISTDTTLYFAVYGKTVTGIDKSTKDHLTIFGLIALSNSVFTFFRAFLFAYGGIVAATRIHNKLLSSVFNAQVTFFDITPIGRVMNRFSSDLYAVDDSLPFILNILLAQLFGVLGTLVLACYGVPWFAAVLVPLSVVYFYTQNYYRKTSREVKRIYSTTLSPIYEHFAETLVGLTTIRAFHENSRFSGENEIKLTANQRANFAVIVAGQWLKLRLQLIGVAMVTVIAVMAVLEHHYSTIDPGLVGLAISYALSVTQRLSGVVNSFTETEKEMINVERTQQYTTEIKQEQGGILMVDRYWPHNGGIFFRDITLVYREGLSPSLYNVSLYVNPREKIGICGRTGSGKSSLFLALFQMVTLSDGEILIDGVNISHIPLPTLRSRLAIIPQDPFLFNDSIRQNLDPDNKYPDSELWSVLERCHVEKAIRDLGGLNATVGEKGWNLSMGQRQLLCLARALLKRSKIICIDEATASVDLETDVVIQRTIKREFQDSTVLTIAHRMETILDSDRVVVMDKGKVAEFASPNNLLLNKKSLFHALVKSSKRR